MFKNVIPQERYIIMINYFEAADRKERYNKLSDYEKGYIDGIYTISNNIENKHRPLITDNLSEYIEEYITANKNCPPPDCTTLEGCAEIFTYDFLMYYEEMVMDLLTRDYIITIAGFLGKSLPDDTEAPENSREYKRYEKEYAQGLLFYIGSQTRLHSKLNEYQNGVIAAYTSMFSTLDMCIKTHLECDEEAGVEGVEMQILDVLEGNVDIPIKPNTPVFIPVLEKLYPIFLSNDIMDCCLDHVNDKCRDEYMYYISQFTHIPYDEVMDTVMNS